MFKKHPGKKATESAESQSNIVQTAGKTDDAEGDLCKFYFSAIVICVESRLMKWKLVLICSLMNLFIVSLLFILLIHFIHSFGRYVYIESLSSESESNPTRHEL